MMVSMPISETWGGQLSVVDIQNKKEIKMIAGFFEPHGPVCLPAGDKVYVANMGSHEVGVVDVKKLELIKRINVGSAYVMAMVDMPNKLSKIVGIANPTLTPDGRYAYAADGDSDQVAVIDTATDSVIATIPVGDEPWRAYDSPDGTKMVVPNNGDQTISVIDTKTNKVIATFPGGEDMTGVNFVNGGKKAYVISRGEGAVYVIDMVKMKELKRLKLGQDLDLETASTTPDGKFEIKEKAAGKPCAWCGMSITNSKTLYYLTLDTGEIKNTCCAHCAIYAKMKFNDRLILMESLDYYNGTRLNSQKAWFVKDPDIQLVDSMPPYILAFDSLQSAQGFQREHQGEIIDYERLEEEIEKNHDPNFSSQISHLTRLLSLPF